MSSTGHKKTSEFRTEIYKEKAKIKMQTKSYKDTETENPNINL